MERITRKGRSHNWGKALETFKKSTNETFDACLLRICKQYGFKEVANKTGISMYTIKGKFYYVQKEGSIDKKERHFNYNGWLKSMKQKYGKTETGLILGLEKEKRENLQELNSGY